MKSIDPMTHQREKQREEERHLARLGAGKPVCLGERYRGIVSAGGESVDGPFIAAAYEKGTLMLLSEDEKRVFFLGEDVAEERGWLYTRSLPTPDIRLRVPAGEAVRNVNGHRERILALRRAAGFKWMSLLSEEGAEILLAFLEDREALGQGTV